MSGDQERKPVRRMSRKRQNTVEQLAEAEALMHFPRGVYAAHGAMGRGLLKGGVAAYLRDWILTHGCLPEGVHDVPWNRGQNLLRVDFTRLQHDPDYPSGSLWRQP